MVQPSLANFFNGTGPLAQRLANPGPFRNWISANRNGLLGFAANVDGTAPTFAQALQPAFKGMAEGGMIDTEAGLLAAQEADRQAQIAQQQQERNQLVELLQQNAPDLMPWVEAGRADEAFNEFVRRTSPQGPAEAPETVTMFDPATGRDQVMQWNGSTWVPLGGVEAPSGPLVNIGGSVPAPAQGYRNVFDENNNLVRQERIPGGPADEEAIAAAAAAESGQQTRTTAANVVVQDIDRALDAIESNPMMTTGLGAALTQNIPGMPAFNVRSLTNTIRANAGFDKLQAMRDASPTGGALGPVSEIELSLLQAAIGDLELSQNDQQVRDNLKRVKNIYLDIIYGPNAGPPREQLSFDPTGGGVVGFEEYFR